MQNNASSCSHQSSANVTIVGSSVDSDTSSGVKSYLPLSSQQSISLVEPAAESLEGGTPVERLEGGINCDLKAASTDDESKLPHTNGPFQAEEESLVPFDKRQSYLRISRRLQKIRVLPALAACFSSLVVTSAICGAELATRAVDISSPLALLCSSVVACMLAVFAAHKKSHVFLVGVVLLEVLLSLYSVAFASVGLVNVGQLRKRQECLQQDNTMQAEQRENALKISRRMLIEQAVFAGLYFLIAAAHCCAAASVNHLRATVRPFDSRLRRKRQRARAMKKLNVLPPPNEEETKETEVQRTKTESSLKELQLLHNSAEEPLSLCSHSYRAGEDADEQSGDCPSASSRTSASNTVRSSSASSTESSQAADENSVKMLEA
ncbi:hypothetical protein, conserved [Eimeria praecox]|uniref:Transmembrane protein n=1 Tax=Eimeria praecox TaxID=51316 RepID=U6H5F3_9EIME|nr:hypothetical protein, conserved [Eimeria praecox]